MTNDATIHLLGYLTPKQWADAIKKASDGSDFSLKSVLDHLQEQDETYGNIVESVIDELYDRHGEQLECRVKVANRFKIPLCLECGEQLDGQNAICRYCNDG